MRIARNKQALSDERRQRTDERDRLVAIWRQQQEQQNEKAKHE
jgi:hypothetical protein